jgi:hypothetical protein
MFLPLTFTEREDGGLMRTNWLAVYGGVLAGLAIAQDQPVIYPGVTVAASYGYNISGRTDRVKGFLVKIEDPRALKKP